MLLPALIIFLISLIVLTKDPVWNKWQVHSVLDVLKELIQTKGDIPSLEYIQGLLTKVDFQLIGVQLKNEYD